MRSAGTGFMARMSIIGLRLMCFLGLKRPRGAQHILIVAAVLTITMILLLRIFFCGLLVLFSPLLSNFLGNVGLSDFRGPGDRGVRHNKDFRGVVVWLEPMNGKPSLAGAPHRYRMEQKDKHFIPHVMAVPVGAVVDFPNRDPIFHNVFSNYSGQVFDLVLYP